MKPVIRLRIPLSIIMKAAKAIHPVHPVASVDPRGAVRFVPDMMISFNAT
jgi:hypothetical protein